MPGDAEEGIEVEMLPLVLSLAPCGGAGCCPRPPLPWRWGRPGTIAGPWAAGDSGEMPGDAEEGTEVKMLPLVLSLAPLIPLRQQCIITEAARASAASSPPLLGLDQEKAAVLSMQNLKVQSFKKYKGPNLPVHRRVLLEGGEPHARCPSPPEGAPVIKSAGFPPAPPRSTERTRGPFYPNKKA